MTQEDKNLLLKDLCSRLPYEVILVAPNGKTTYQTDGNTGAELLVEEGFKPYLRPLSSMTEEEKKEYEWLANHCIVTSVGFVHLESQTLIDWLNSNHFDYRNLIDKGLALEAPEGRYN